MENESLKKCLTCNKEYPLDAVFCTNCGTRLEEEKALQEEVGTLRCPSCGKGLPPDAVFCTNCGTRLEREEVQEGTADETICSACGHELPPSAVFCTNCGKRLADEGAQKTQGEPSMGRQFMGLANEFLSVREVRPGRFEFSSHTGAQSPAQKARVKYDAIVQLEPEKKQLIFWEKMVETSAGSDSGFYSEKTVQKGLEVTKTVYRDLLFGGKYGFEYGKLRAVINAVAGEQGWKLKLVIFKPK